EYTAVVRLRFRVEILSVNQPEVIFINVSRMLAAAFFAAGNATFLVFTLFTSLCCLGMAFVPGFKFGGSGRILGGRHAYKASTQADGTLHPERELDFAR